MDPKSNGKISVVSFTYIMLTNMVGCLIAIALFFVIKPGIQHHLSKKMIIMIIEIIIVILIAPHIIKISL